jgi:hypothetical protein
VVPNPTNLLLDTLLAGHTSTYFAGAAGVVEHGFLADPGTAQQDDMAAFLDSLTAPAAEVHLP